MINLRDSYIKVDWDPSRRDLFVPLWGKVNDTGRGLVVTIYQKGMAIVATTETLRINWEKTDGTEGFVEAVISGGKFYVEELVQMFSVPGIVKADLQLQVGAEFIKSDTFKVPVIPSIADQALLSSSEFTALQEALAEISNLEGNYAPRLNSVETQLAETMNKTAITLNHIFADNTARDTYFTANPLEKINLTFIKVGTGYQQLINDAWTSANPILVEAVNQIDDTSTGLTKTLSASKELALLALKSDKVLGTNLVTNGDFSQGTTGWTATTATFQVSGGVAQITPTASLGRIRKIVSSVFNANDIYYVSAKVKTSSSTVQLYTTDDVVGGVTMTAKGTNVFEALSFIYRQTVSVSVINIFILETAVSGFVDIFADDVMLINLTKTFGVGNEPTKEQMDRLLTEFPNSWFDGTQEILPLKVISQLLDEKANKAQEAWITPTLLNGWLPYDESRTPKYMKDQMGFVHLTGAIKSGANATKLFILPAGYRPLNTVGFAVNSNNAGAGSIYIGSTGDVIVTLGSATMTYLDGMIFKI